jgi:WS/DGAT/MGAT family acyltransferase
MAEERMGTLDRAFVLLERTGLPMHVGGLAILDPTGRAKGPIRRGELRRRVQSRLSDLPIFRARLNETPFALRGPVWVPDGDFDIDRHLERVVLPPGSGMGDLHQLAADLHSRLLPRDRPLWRVTLIDGLPEGRQALLTTTHHAITDGVAGVEVAQVIFDRPVHAAAPVQPVRPAQNGPAGANGYFGSGGGGNGLTSALQAAIGVARYLVGGPVALPYPFNGPVGERRALATADLRLEDAIAIKRRLGGSVDDVVLASVALAVGAHLERAGWQRDGLRLRTLVPVSTVGGAGGGFGNRVTATFLDLPMDLAPMQCLHEIAAAKALHRSWHEPLGLYAALLAAGRAPAALAGPMTCLVGSLPFANLIVSDIPGPREPLSLLGVPMLRAYPLMPLAPTIGLAIAVVTIAGAMGVGVTTDPDLVPDGDELARGIKEAFAELLRTARGQPAPPSRRSS